MAQDLSLAQRCHAHASVLLAVLACNLRLQHLPSKDRRCVLVPTLFTMTTAQVDMYPVCLPADLQEAVGCFLLCRPNEHLGWHHSSGAGVHLDGSLDHVPYLLQLESSHVAALLPDSGCSSCCQSGSPLQ